MKQLTFQFFFQTFANVTLEYNDEKTKEYKKIFWCFLYNVHSVFYINKLSLTRNWDLTYNCYRTLLLCAAQRHVPRLFVNQKEGERFNFYRDRNFNLSVETITKKRVSLLRLAPRTCACARFLFAQVMELTLASASNGGGENNWGTVYVGLRVRVNYRNLN